MNRRAFISTLAAAGSVILSGCSQEKNGKLVNDYTRAYRKYTAGDKTGSHASNAEGQRQSNLYTASAALYREAGQQFKSLQRQTENETGESMCGEAGKYCQLKEAEVNDLASGKKVLALIHTRAALEYSVAHPTAFQDAISSFGEPGDPTVGEVTPVAASVATETATPADVESTTPTETEEPTKTVNSPNFLAGLSGSTLPDTSVKGYYDREFTQSVSGSATKFSLQIPKAQYQYYNRRLRIADYGGYLADIFDDQNLKGIATSLEEYGERNDHSKRQIVDHAIAWVQGMKYAQDKPATGYNEYPKYPLETLVDRGGDCEDTAILLAGVLQHLGYDTRLIELPDAKHMAVGVAGNDELPGSYYTDGGTRFYYVETTGEGWRVGEIPDDVQNEGTRAQLLELGNYPSLAIEWRTAVDTDRLRVETTIHNVGDHSARSVAGQVDVVDSDGNIVDQDRTSYPTVSPEQGVTKSLTVNPPVDQQIKVRVGALLDANLMDLSETDYRSP